MHTEAHIHSIETMGTLDGPGLRYVIFLQGCPLRCGFCHNPDTWRMKNGKVKTVDELLANIMNYIPYFKSSGGGVTVSGGEPLLQADFVSELFQELHKLHIHKVIDTSGFAEVDKIKNLMSLTDLVMLSIKHPDPEHHHRICGQSQERPLALARYLSRIKMPVWIRYVLIPGVSSRPDDLKSLAEMIKKMPNVQKLELLPYNTLGKSKWQALGITSDLLEIPPPTPQEVEAARQLMTRLLPNIKVV